jgi:hypothetical protein
MLNGSVGTIGAFLMGRVTYWIGRELQGIGERDAGGRLAEGKHHGSFG